MNKITVLIVENDAIAAVHLRNMLTELGYSVTGTAATGEIAIATAIDTSPELILMDIELAGQIDGITTIGRIRAAYDVPVIFLIGHSQELRLQRAKTTEPYDYLIKPFSQQELAVTIKMAFYRTTVDKRFKEKNDKLQKSEAFNLAILNSVTASIAVLNLDGEIVAVNETWQQFAIANSSTSGKTAVHTGVGSNYLAICRDCSSSTVAGDAADASKACSGIKAVLAGRSTDFSLEYPCHSPEEKRWFCMSVTPLGGDKAGVVVAHTNITERKIAEEGLQKAHDEMELRVLERTAELALANKRLTREIEERLQIGAFLKESNRMLQALSFVQSHYISGLSIANLFELVLDDFLLLTDSTIGFIGEILETPARGKYIKMFALSDISWDDESRKIHARASSGGEDFHNPQSLFGAVLQTGKAVIANKPDVDQRRGGLPAGHPTLETFLGLPIHHNGELTGVVGLANRPGGFDDKLVEYLNPFLVTCGSIIEAYRNRQQREVAEEALRESEEKYRTVADFNYDWETWRSPDGTFRYVSPSCQRITGYAAADFLADPNLFMQITHLEDRHKIIEYYQAIKYRVHDQAIIFDFRILTSAGEIRWIGHSSTSVQGNDGQWLGRRESNRDITDWVEIQERAYKSNATLNMTIDGLPDPLFLLDAEMRVKKLNRAAKEYYGLADSREAIGKSCFEGFRGRSNPCAGCESPFSDMYGYSGSFERRGHLDRDRLEEVVVDLVRDRAGKPKATIFRINDITKERTMDRQLVQNEKLASLGLLIAGVAHEINNPNNFIYFNTPILRSYLQFLLPIADEYASAKPELLVFNRPYAAFREDSLKLLDNIEHGSTRINQIVSNLREFTRERGKGERRRIDLKMVVEKGLSICRGRIKKLVKTLDVQIPEGLATLVSDPQAIQQIVVNLMVNAAHAADKSDSWIRLTISENKSPAGEVVVEVSDNGCGMDSETRKKIFDPFYTTKAVGVGTGLGLSISHRLVTEIGGRIEVESEVGAGSTFRVVLATKNDE